MAIFRTQEEPIVTFYKNEQDKHQFGNQNEWMNEPTELGIQEECRVDIPSWQSRYNYECDILNSIINDNQFKNIIEIGSGPGELGQKILNKQSDLNYTFIDQLGAQQIFESRQYKGRFLVKDLMNSFDTSDLDKDYDFLITNDFLEHIYNPSIIVQECYKIIKNGGKMFVSVPNWRMGHTFIYRGLFDYDNFIYFMYTHGFKISGIWESPLKCPFSPKETSESEMDDRLITSWNWYMLFDKI
jgi:2-polyprenyl-3-methyl-5-hydroxy-6-metoxy-1,4-benzoquinol methylase